MSTTIVIHGTFARGEKWWRPGFGGNSSFADELEIALGQMGMPGTVWPQGIDPEDFAWSGANSDSDRRKAAEDIAAKLKAHSPQPLELNIVAHSHGGNVALELLSQLQGSPVKVRRLVLLGTPMVVYQRASQIIKFFLALTAFLSLIYIGARVLTGLLAWPIPTMETWGQRSYFAESPGFGDAAFLVLAVLILSWIAGVVVLIGDILFHRLWKRAFPYYGPPVEGLVRDIGNSKVVLFGSEFDEAAVLLQATSAPLEVADGFLSRKFGRLVQLAFRPWLILLIRGLEPWLESWALGIRLWKLALRDVQMEDLNQMKAYTPASLQFRAIPLNIVSALAHEEPKLRAPDWHKRQKLALAERIEGVVSFLTGQIKLRHSFYYSAPSVIHEIAKSLK